jgi:hypothetical protein
MANQFGFDNTSYDFITNIDDRKITFDNMSYDFVANVDDRRITINNMYFDFICSFAKGLQVNNVTYDIIYSAATKPNISRPKKAIKNLS